MAFARTIIAALALVQVGNVAAQTGTPAADASASVCQDQEHVVSGACVACAPGTQRAAGDPLSGDDTACSAWTCAENERVAEYACVACAPGKTNAAGDDASVADTNTAADAWTAPSDSTFPAPGSQFQRSVNTYCTATVCAADEYVSDEHVCTACPGGTTNAFTPVCTGALDAAGVACTLNLDSTACAVADGDCAFASVGDDASGVATSCDATLCAVNELVSGNACVACPAGTTNDAGDHASGSDTVCDATICGENQFVSASTCTDCAAGTTRPAGDDASAVDENGAAVNTVCGVCAEDYFVNNGACTACATGTQRPAGDPAGGDDTTCDRCAADWHSDGTQCVQCAAGSSNDDNDLASGPATACVHTICAREQYVSSNVCTDCPPGTVNLHLNHADHGAQSGDDATDADTVCTAVTCGANERVSGNVCVPCNVGFVSAGGDDSSSSDTTCSWDGSYCAVHTIEAAAYCKGANGATVTAADEAECEGAVGSETGNLWTRHTYTLPKWANGAGAGLKAPSDCVAEDGSTDCDIYDTGTGADALCAAYTPVTAAPHCRNTADALDTGCDIFDHSEERCLGYGDCYAPDGGVACDAHDGTSTTRAGDRAGCLALTASLGCLFKDATADSALDGVCSWGGAATCAFTAAESFDDGTDKKCDSCPLGVSSTGRPCSCALACAF